MNRPGRGAAAARGMGFTLVEVAVVITLVGVLAGVAVVFIKPRSIAATPRGYADEIAALTDSVRQRAVASRTFQRLEVQADRVIHWQATTTGIATPVDYDLIGMLPASSQVVIAAMSDRTHVAPNDGVPAAGVGLPGEVLFSPDGSAGAATIFVEDVASDSRARVAIYRATGSAYVYYEW